MANYDVRKCDQCGETDKWDYDTERIDAFHHVGYLQLNWVIGPDEMKDYDFCSFGCLREWLEKRTQ